MNQKLTEKAQKSLSCEKLHEELQLNLDHHKMKKKILLEKSACVQLKTHFRGFENRLIEVIINEKFLEMTGYSLEQFISVVLSEGLPR